MISTPGATVSAQLLADAVTDETLSPWIDVRGRAHLVFYCTSTGTGTTTSGVISFEEAAPSVALSDAEGPSQVFGGATDAYSVITTKNVNDFTGSKQVAVHPTVAAYCFVRARISTAIGGGGTVNVGLVAY